MPAYTIGEDLRVTVNAPFGSFPIPQMTKFVTNPNQSILKSQDLSGRTNTRTIMSATSGSITFNRTGPGMEQLMSQMYQYWLAGTPIPQGSIFAIINEVLTGGETDVNYTPCSFAIKDIGDYSAMKGVTQTLEWQCENGGVIV